jgi:hypothetical protein
MNLSPNSVVFLIDSASNDTQSLEAIEMPTLGETTILLFHLANQLSTSRTDQAPMGGNPPAGAGRLCEESPIARLQVTDKRWVYQAVDAPGNRSHPRSVRAW